MALLQKKPQLSSSLPLYTTGIGDNRFLVIGLGNPEKKYDGTRHNIGFSCVDAFAIEHDFPKWSHKSDQRSDIANQQLANNQIILIKPTTYMNKSGDATASVAQFYKISPSNIIVIYDDKDVQLGQIRTQVGGSSAGHNGVTSIIDAIGSEFGRVRVGIGREELVEDTSRFVLSRFSKDEQEVLPSIIKETTAILTEYIFSGSPLPKETRNIL